MPVVEGGYVNPYYQEVDDFVKKELGARGKYYGARVRSSRWGAQKFPRDLSWSYQKVAYVIVTPVGGGPQLGGSYSRIMSDRKGKLTLYDSTRNQPKYPLLQSLEISNEGTIGSLLKGKFTFTVYPDLYKTGFRIETLEESYFKPGKEVNIVWGWSSYAASSNACKGSMTGIIYNFDWTVNQDLSITANCAIVSKATIAIGLSGEQTNPEQTNPPDKDPLNNPIPDSDLAGIIEADIAALQGAGKGTSVSLGQKVYIDKKDTKSGKKFTPYGLGYYAIGLPKSQQDSDAGDGKSKTAPPIVEPVYYTPLKDITQLINGLMVKGQPSGSSQPIYRIICDGNVTEYYQDSIVSCSPERVFFPDEWMGNYGNYKPFTSTDDSPLVRAYDPAQQKEVLLMENGKKLVNIGNILISTSTVIEVYRRFVKENQTNIEYKNITSFINDLIKEVNYASGEVYQLSARLIEPEMLSSEKNGRRGKSTDPAILSIEDSNLSSAVVEAVDPVWIISDISSPLIKNISITSKPPGPMSAAAYAEARGKSGPQQTDVRTAKDKEIDTQKFDDEFKEAKKAFDDIKFAFQSTGAGDKFSTDLKGAFAKFKRSSRGGDSAKGTGAHWLNRALYPVELSLTLDGINGFKFGDVIKTNLIPATYNREDTDMVFVVTKITHTVKDGIWETKLDTKSRINMGQASPDKPAPRP